MVSKIIMKNQKKVKKTTPKNVISKFHKKNVETDDSCDMSDREMKRRIGQNQSDSEIECKKVSKIENKMDSETESETESGTEIDTETESDVKEIKVTKKRKCDEDNYEVPIKKQKIQEDSSDEEDLEMEVDSSINDKETMTAITNEEDSDDNEEDSDNSEEEIETVKHVSKKVPELIKNNCVEEDSDDSDDSEEIENVKPVSKKVPELIKNNCVEENSEDSDDSEEEIVTVKAVPEKGKKLIKDVSIKKVTDDNKEVKQTVKPVPEKVLEANNKVILKKDKAKSEISKLFEQSENVKVASLREKLVKRFKLRMSCTIILGTGKKIKNDYITEMFPNRVSCIISYNMKQKVPSGQIYVDFSSPEAAQKAVIKAVSLKHKAFIQNRAVLDVDSYNCNRLAITNINPLTNIEKLKQLLKKATNIAFLPEKKYENKTSRVAFAEYNSVEDAITDYDAKHGTIIDEYPLNIKFQLRSGSNQHENKAKYNYKKILVSGIKAGFKIDYFKELFPKANKINFISSQSVATIIYETEEESKKDFEQARYKKDRDMRLHYDAVLGVSDAKTAGKAINKDNKKFDNKDNKKFDNKVNKKFDNKVNKKFDNKDKKFDNEHNEKIDNKDNKKFDNKVKKKFDSKKSNFKPKNKSNQNVNRKSGGSKPPFKKTQFKNKGMK